MCEPWLKPISELRIANCECRHCASHAPRVRRRRAQDIYDAFARMERHVSRCVHCAQCPQPKGFHASRLSREAPWTSRSSGHAWASSPSPAANSARRRPRDGFPAGSLPTGRTRPASRWAAHRFNLTCLAEPEMVRRRQRPAFTRRGAGSLSVALFHAGCGRRASVVAATSSTCALRQRGRW